MADRTRRLIPQAAACDLFDDRIGKARARIPASEAKVWKDSRRVDSSLLLPGAACRLKKNVTHPSGRDGQQIEEATERGDKA